MFKQAGTEEETRPGAELFKLVGVGVEQREEAGGEGDGGGEGRGGREEKGVPGKGRSHVK